MKREFRDNSGVSLIEIVAALVLLSIVAFPLAKTFMDGFKFQARGQIKTEANKVIEYVAEQLKNEQYNTLKDGLSDTIVEWAKGEGASSVKFSVTSISGTNLSAEYDVEIDKIDKESTFEVQAGGMGTPSEYELTLSIDDSESNISGNGNYIYVDYDSDSGLLSINEDPRNKDPENNMFYSVLIENTSSSSVNIAVKKMIPDKVKIYTKGDVKLSVATNPDPDLTREHKKFEQIKLGNKNEIKDEYLCEAKITATNRNDKAIKASMNVTFSVFDKKEEV